MSLEGKRIAIMLDQKYQELEVWYPLYRLIEAGARQGHKFVFRQLRFLLANRRYLWFMWAFMDNGLRFLGFNSGRRHKFLPLWLKKKLSLHSKFWDKQ